MNKRRYFENKCKIRSNMLLLHVNKLTVSWSRILWEINPERIKWKSRVCRCTKKISNPSKQKFQETHNLWYGDPAKGRALTTPWAIVPFHFREPWALTPPSNVRGDNASLYQEYAQSYRVGYKTILLCYNKRENILRLLLQAGRVDFEHKFTRSSACYAWLILICNLKNS